MAKILVALLVLTLSTIAFTDTKCKRCGYVKKHTHYPPYSKQLQEVIGVASKETKIPLSKKDVEIINKIISKEDGSGNLTEMYNGCYGLGQGKKGSYIGAGIPWKTTCPVEQIEMILLYVKYRKAYGYKKNKSFGTLTKAWAHRQKHDWY